MINFKEEIAKIIEKVINIPCSELEEYIEVPKDTSMGDYAFPCFRLAKELKKAPPMIANEIKEKIEYDENVIEKLEVIGGYLNFYVNKQTLIENVLKEFENKKDKYGKSGIGKGKNIIVEYSSPNIAKPFHIGHLRNTVIGAALYNVYKYLGYNTIGMNHLGDYGTQFGKLIEGYKNWGEEYDLTEKPIEKLMDIYVRINEACKDEKVLEACRENFRLLENNDEYCTDLWNKFKDLSLKEFQKIYDLLGVKFDAIIGEAFYIDKMNKIYELLEKANVLKESEGAQIVDLEEKGLGACIIKKANGSSIYATRDLAAIKYRAENYAFDKCLYVVAYEQALHFKQLFEVAKYLEIPEKCVNGLEHVQYGMVHLKTGKMSTREGNVIKVEDLLNESIQRVEKIIEEKNPEMEDKKEVAKKIGIGAVVFNNLANTIIKDQVFDWDTILNFQGETGPYIQYIYVRTKSVMENVGYIPKLEDVKVENISDKESVKIIKLIYSFTDILESVTEKNEPSILARYLIDLAKSYSAFYNENKVMVEEKEIKDARAYLTHITGSILKTGAKLLGMEMPDRM